VAELFDSLRRIPARPLQGREHELDPQPTESRRIPLPASRRLRPLPADLYSQRAVCAWECGRDGQQHRRAQLLFRLGIVSDLPCGTIVIFLVQALYRLLKGVDHNLAVLMVIVGGVLPATIDFINVLNDAAALMFVRDADFLSLFEKPHLDALAMPSG
jgi:hypothetical protein